MLFLVPGCGGEAMAYSVGQKKKKKERKKEFA